MRILRLGREHRAEVARINRVTLEALADKSFYIPFPDEELATLFDAPDPVMYGVADDDGGLVAVSGLFFHFDDLLPGLEGLPVDPARAAEIGASMTLPAYRGRGYMSMLNRALVREARQAGVRCLLATAHPDNTASNRSLQRMGMQQRATFLRGAYLRTLYLMDI
ncbi:MAG: GNAT family N-acetyltransferase [Rikenellaceae bacterium]|nr:GNAT family N-acetyltransferase [Rikenellaceae bacterium]